RGRNREGRHPHRPVHGTRVNRASAPLDSHESIPCTPRCGKFRVRGHFHVAICSVELLSEKPKNLRGGSQKKRQVAEERFSQTRAPNPVFGCGCGLCAS